ncbi:MAG: glutamine--fructose-6-phosphate transaminase (isomerizing) [Coxiellaceae bacterium]|nr:glutamine--fructose-6-phosphate transaminase (isomerizing) [Coxiellaceae bacterium]
MCGIVGAIANRPVTPILVEGLKRLEYRGYDSAGVSVLNANLESVRTKGKVDQLAQQLNDTPLVGSIGIAHTRWATHGAPCEKNAHPHHSHDTVAIVHNGIIENYTSLKQELINKGYIFNSDTDSETIAHLLHHLLKTTTEPREAIKSLRDQLQGAYAIGIILKDYPDTIFAVRQGSPLVIGIGVEEHFIASDSVALLPVTQRHIFLEEGDIAQLTTTQLTIIDKSNNLVDRPVVECDSETQTTSKGHYRHFMQKEMYQQPQTIKKTFAEHINHGRVQPSAFGEKAGHIFQQTQRVRLLACGTSYHAALVASYWIESYANLPCTVDIASEYRYKDTVVEPNTLFVALSQSGETADTLAALSLAQQQSYLATLCICNVSTSTLVRETDIHFITQAGTEIGVAATKTFTAQLTALMLLCSALAEHHKSSSKLLADLDINTVIETIETTLQLDTVIAALAHRFIDKHSALYIARGSLYPIAMEGALKLKEISYCHAEAYAAGELKHGTLALVDNHMPIVVLAPHNRLFKKMCSNVEEIQARGGKVYVVSDDVAFWSQQDVTLIPMPTVNALLEPLVYTIPLQLMAYHIAVAKGTDVDQPRNLAKSVTVE